MQSRLADRMLLYLAPKVFGGRCLGLYEGVGERLASAPSLRDVTVDLIPGEETLIVEGDYAWPKGKGN